MEKNGIILFSMEADRIPPGAAERIREAGGGRDLLVTLDDRIIEENLDRIEIGFGDVPFHLLARMPRLAWVQLWSAGADRLQQFPELKGLPFVLTSTSGMHGQQLAEHTFGLILAWNRSFPKVFEARTRKEWLRINDSETAILEGKNMLILGYGRIGEMMARVARAFNMKVTGLRRNPERSAAGLPGKDSLPGVKVAGIEDLPELLGEADLVVNILPATPETRHIFGVAEFGLMKQGSLYVNVGRGSTTDEAALIDALKTRWIAGALLDVTGIEPLPPSSPLWDLDNVIISGHYAGMHPCYGKLALEIALENLGRYVRGEELRGIVDKTLGY
ncbi:MAG: D-2-hydroxyacid dehydrogenase [Treponema sp.]|jgi:phosphoglycerate dehydrogenase-like enzyme|nr:D-2-hydroxyacid dehydrogenase [Treponema sp.]